MWAVALGGGAAALEELQASARDGVARSGAPVAAQACSDGDGESVGAYSDAFATAWALLRSARRPTADGATALNSYLPHAFAYVDFDAAAAAPLSDVGGGAWGSVPLPPCACVCGRDAQDAQRLWRRLAGTYRRLLGGSAAEMARAAGSRGASHDAAAGSAVDGRGERTARASFDVVVSLGDAAFDFVPGGAEAAAGAGVAGALRASPPPLALAARAGEHAVAAPGHTWHYLGFTGHSFVAARDDAVFTPWRSRDPRLVWRGAVGFLYPPSRAELVALSVRQPSLVDALAVNGDSANRTRMSPESMARYKYRIYLPGIVGAASSTLKEELARGQLVFLRERDLAAHAPWYARYLRAWEHYVPLEDAAGEGEGGATGLGDLESKLRWAQAHDTEAEAIAARAARFARGVLSDTCAAAALRGALAAYAQWAADAVTALPPGSRYRPWGCPANCTRMRLAHGDVAAGETEHCVR